MKKIVIIALLSLFLMPLMGQNDVRTLTTKEFREKVFNYTTDTVWQYRGSLPCVIDFYAHWCGPCRRLAPVMEELAEEYCDKVIFYKVNVDEEKELAYLFKASSIPLLVFIPVNGQPQIARGALPKETLIQAIQDVLLASTTK